MTASKAEKCFTLDCPLYTQLIYQTRTMDIISSREEDTLLPVGGGFFCKSTIFAPSENSTTTRQKFRNFEILSKRRARRFRLKYYRSVMTRSRRWMVSAPQLSGTYLISYLLFSVTDLYDIRLSSCHGFPQCATRRRLFASISVIHIFFGNSSLLQ